MPRINGCVSSALTVSLPPLTRLSTPAGNPESWITFQTNCCDSGTCSDGLQMKVLPHATANGKNHIGTIAGKLNGAMHANTPSGWRTDSQSMPCATSSSAVPINNDGAPV